MDNSYKKFDSDGDKLSVVYCILDVVYVKGTGDTYKRPIVYSCCITGEKKRTFHPFAGLHFTLHSHHIQTSKMASAE